MSVDVNSLKNRGLLLLNNERELAAERTIVVLGVARSGTTMIAGALHRMGIPACENENVVFEDVPLSEAAERRDDAALRALIDKRNAAHAVWAWKRPALLQHIARIEPLLRNPEYVVIFRDVFAIANRNRLSVYSDVHANMEDSLRQYGQLLAFLKTCERRALLVSYEKAMQGPARFVKVLARFAGVEDEAALAAARRFIQPEPEAYLKSSRVVRVQGALERAEPQIVSGWCFHKERKEPVTVAIRVNNRVIARVVADQMRADFAAKGHATGLCGFVWRPPAPLEVGDTVSVRVPGELHDLNLSPRTVEARKK